MTTTKSKMLVLALAFAAALCLAFWAFGATEAKAADADSDDTAAAEAAEDAAENDADDADDNDDDDVVQRTVYVSPEWVKDVIEGDEDGYENYVIAEVTYTADPDGEYFKTGHIPTAIQVFDTDVEDAEGTKEAPYNLLPAEEVEKLMLSHGITKDTKVILYGADPAGVGRVAYGYLWAGVEDVKILDGGLEAWTGAGFDLETEASKETAASDFGTTVPAHPEYWVSMEDAMDRLANDDNFRLVSIRAEDEWLGKTSGYSYIDRAGEPEGAVWGKGAQTAFDVADFLNADGTVKDLDGFKDVWADCDFTLDNDLAFYCGTGWRATVPFLVLYENGYDNIAVYDGGWYEWQMYDENPVQVGDPASKDCEHVTVADLPTDKAAKS